MTPEVEAAAEHLVSVLELSADVRHAMRLAHIHTACQDDTAPEMRAYLTAVVGLVNAIDNEQSTTDTEEKK